MLIWERLDVNHPKTFNEKLHWLKLNDRNPEYTIMVDKYEVKDYVNKICGGGYRAFEENPEETAYSIFFIFRSGVCIMAH